MKDVYVEHKCIHGEFPEDMTELTEDRLSGFAGLIKLGSNPYCDFSIFKVYGHRVQSCEAGSQLAMANGSK